MASPDFASEQKRLAFPRYGVNRYVAKLTGKGSKLIGTHQHTRGGKPVGKRGGTMLDANPLPK